MPSGFPDLRPEIGDLRWENSRFDTVNFKFQISSRKSNGMNDLNEYKLYALGDRAAVIDLGNTISEELNRKVLSMHAWMRLHPFPGLRDLVAAYSSLTVLYDPLMLRRESGHNETAFEQVKHRLEEAWVAVNEADKVSPRTISIPVCYDPAFGYDLEEMAAAKNLAVPELISLHCSTTYRVYMLGFLPGFAYMGKVDERLVMPRRSQPREVAAGSVGIAGWQTGIYPLSSPGGWQIIGRAPVKLFDKTNEPPALLAAGDSVQFYSITKEEFDDIAMSH